MTLQEVLGKPEILLVHKSNKRSAYESTIKLRKNSAISHRKLDKYADMNKQMKAHLNQFRGWCKFESYSNVFDSYFVKVATKSSLVTFKKVKFI